MTKKTAFIKCGCYSVVLFSSALFLGAALAAVIFAGLGMDDWFAPFFGFLMWAASMFASGGCVGLYIWESCVKCFDHELKPTRRDAFIKGGGVYCVILLLVVIFISLISSTLAWVIKIQSHDTILSHSIKGVVFILFYYIAILFVTGGCTGLYMRKKYLKLLATAHTPKMDNAA